MPDALVVVIVRVERAHVRLLEHLVELARRVAVPPRPDRPDVLIADDPRVTLPQVVVEVEGDYRG